MQRNLDAYTRLIDRGYNGRDLSVVEDVCSDSYMENQFPTPTGSGKELVYTDLRNLHSAIPDVKLTIVQLDAADDRVWSLIEAVGTDAVSGKPVKCWVMDLMRFEDGKIVEHWGVPDRFAMMCQTGQVSL